MVFGYHNHNQEYRDGADRVYELMQAVPGFTAELDIFWATAGGHDPVELMRKYGKRLTALHIKEMDKRTNIANPTEYHEAIVGEGMSNTAAVMEYAKKLGIELFVLEVESYPCDYEEYLEKSCANMKSSQVNKNTNRQTASRTTDRKNIKSIKEILSWKK